MDNIFLYITNNILQKDMQVDRIREYTRNTVNRFLYSFWLSLLFRRSKEYKFSNEEMQIITRCKKERKKKVINTLLGGSAIIGIGLLISKDKKVILQYGPLRWCFFL